jgi:hypothetical protein
MCVEWIHLAYDTVHYDLWARWWTFCFYNWWWMYACLADISFKRYCCMVLDVTLWKYSRSVTVTWYDTWCFNCTSIEHVNWQSFFRWCMLMAVLLYELLMYRTLVSGAEAVKRERDIMLPTLWALGCYFSSPLIILFSRYIYIYFFFLIEPKCCVTLVFIVRMKSNLRLTKFPENSMKSLRQNWPTCTDKCSIFRER